MASLVDSPVDDEKKKDRPDRAITSDSASSARLPASSGLHTCNERLMLSTCVGGVPDVGIDRGDSSRRTSIRYIDIETKS